MKSPMKSVLVLLVLSLTALLASGLAAQTAAGIAAEPGAKPKRLSADFEFTEGPCADAAGNVWFTDQPRNKIWVWTVTGELRLMTDKAGRSNGMNFTPQGQLVACADEKNQLVIFDAPDPVAGLGSPSRVLAATYQGKPLNGPNDVFVHPSGGIYLTDPYYQRDWFPHKTQPQKSQAVYYLAPGATGLTLASDQFQQPNGIIGTPDGKKLYVADIGAGKTFSFTIQPDGSLTDKTLFCSQGSDGMTIDSEGNVYLTGNGVTVFDSTGKKIDYFKLRDGWTANVCFGGSDRSTLFITASRSLYALKTRVKGAFAAGK